MKRGDTGCATVKGEAWSVKRGCVIGGKSRFFLKCCFFGVWKLGLFFQIAVCFWRLVVGIKDKLATEVADFSV